MTLAVKVALNPSTTVSAVITIDKVSLRTRSLQANMVRYFYADLLHAYGS